MPFKPSARLAFVSLFCAVSAAQAATKSKPAPKTNVSVGAPVKGSGTDKRMPDKAGRIGRVEPAAPKSVRRSALDPNYAKSRTARYVALRRATATGLITRADVVAFIEPHIQAILKDPEYRTTLTDLAEGKTSRLGSARVVIRADARQALVNRLYVYYAE